MFYERKVKYLDDLVKQEKCGNAGFVKLEARGDICNIWLSVSGLGAGAPGTVTVYFLAGEQEKELCRLEVSGGKANKALLAQPLNNLGGTGITYEELEAVRIPISQERQLYVKVGQAKMPEPIELPEGIETSKAIRTLETPQISDPIELPKIIEVAEHEPTGAELSVPEMIEEMPGDDEEEAEPSKDDIKEKEEVVKEPTVPLCETKWKQLWQLYPHIHPFRDEREYLSLGPGDFVILPERYFCMANNSFLLHGYYNYKHLILKRVEGHGGVRYYIGVPGNFYDREKQVAIMFGFESFESGIEPANVGDYGYYMMRVEL